MQLSRVLAQGTVLNRSSMSRTIRKKEKKKKEEREAKTQGETLLKNKVTGNDCSDIETITAVHNGVRG